MHGALEPGQQADLAGRCLEEGVLLDALGRDHVPQLGDHLLTLARDLRLGQRAVQQVAAVVRRRAAHVVAGAGGHQPHGDQPRVGIGEQPAHVTEVGDDGPVQDAVGRVGDRLVHGVGADADGAPAQVVLAHIDGVECGVEGPGPAVQHVGLGDGVVAKRVVGDVVLRVHHVLFQLVAVVLGVRGEEHVLRAVLRTAGDLAERGDRARHVAVADVVLLPVGGPSAAGFAGRGEDHVRLVDVRAVRLFGEPEGEHLPGLQLRGGLALRLLVVAHPDRAQAQGGDLERVPVAQPVEADDLGELADPVGVPPAVVGAVLRRRQQRCEDALAAKVVEEVRVPHPVVVVGLQPGLSPGLEEVDGRGHDLRRTGVRIPALQVRGVEQHADDATGRTRENATVGRPRAALPSEACQNSAPHADPSTPPILVSRSCTNTCSS